eukprot:g391.t1
MGEGPGDLVEGVKCQFRVCAQLYEAMGAADGPMAMVFTRVGNDAAQNNETPVCMIRSLNRDALSLSGKKVDPFQANKLTQVHNELVSAQSAKERPRTPSGGGRFSMLPKLKWQKMAKGLFSIQLLATVWSWANSKGTGRKSTIIQHNGNQLPVEQVQVVGIATPNDIKVAGNMDPVAALSLGFIFRQQIANQLAVGLRTAAQHAGA